MHTSWEVDSTKILTRSEMSRIIADLRRKSISCRSARQNLVIFRLAACCGLRASEIGGLLASDVKVGIDRPHIVVRKEIAKGGHPRRVPLWWDADTLADLTKWKAELAAPDAPFVASMRGVPKPLSRFRIRDRFLTACGVLGADRLEGLTVHHGRHGFISHALAGGRTLAEVRNAAGHSSIATTSIYTHVAVEEDDQVGALFAFGHRGEMR